MRKLTWIDIKKIYWDNGYPLCWFCRVATATQLHHGIINKAKVRNRKLHKYLDVVENAIPVCDTCHQTADSYEMRTKAYNLKIYEFNKERIDSWLNNLPFTIKEIFHAVQDKEDDPKVDV